MSTDRCPDFACPGSDGRTWTRADLKGSLSVLYFYPKDLTSGCTAESCDFRDHLKEFAKLSARVLGVSPDSLASHAKFIAKEKLTFPLLADESHTMSEAFGVWTQKSMYGRTYMGIERSTFLIGPDLRIERAWRKVKVPGHVAEVLAAIRGL